MAYFKAGEYMRIQYSVNKKQALKLTANALPRFLSLDRFHFVSSLSVDAE